MNLYLAVVRMTTGFGEASNKVTFIQEMEQYKGKRIALARNGANYEDVLTGYVYAPEWLGGLHNYKANQEPEFVDELIKENFDTPELLALYLEDGLTRSSSLLAPMLETVVKNAVALMRTEGWNRQDITEERRLLLDICNWFESDDTETLDAETLDTFSVNFGERLVIIAEQSGE